ncbi:LOW QUALITY PROTEIN: hypothetical protein HMPREF0005_05440, partial [Achromobacter xylosoxidans C54]
AHGGAGVGYRARLGLLHGRRRAGPVAGAAAGADPAAGRRRAFRCARMGLAGGAAGAGGGPGRGHRATAGVDGIAVRAPAPLCQRSVAAARRLVRAHRRAQGGSGAGAAAAGAAARRSGGLCAGFGGELAERCQQGPAGLGPAGVRALADAQPGRGDAAHLPAGAAHHRGV